MGFAKAVCRIILMEGVKRQYKALLGESDGAGALVPNLPCDEAASNRQLCSICIFQ